MLRRMQEASQYMTRAKKKDKEKFVSFSEEVGIGSSSDRFGYQNNQNSRFCNESSSTNCYDELRKVIKKSLGRQNSLPNGSVHAKANFDSKETKFSTDLPFNNSSRTSTTYSHDSASVSSSSSNISEDRPKASNLVAKLMGLEEISPTTLQFESRDKNLNPKRLIFDIDMPKQRKRWLAAQNGDRECMTLEEIIQNMQFKGLLNRDRFPIYDSSTSESENRLRNHAPPVVLMKPVHAGVGANGFFSHKFIPREEDVDFDKKQSMSKTKEESTSRILEHTDKGMLRSYLNKTRIEKITETNLAKPDRKALQKSAHNKVKPTNTASPEFPKDMIDKKVNKVQKSTSMRKSVEKENVKSKDLLKHHEQPKNVSRSHEHLSPPAMKMGQSETGPNLTTKQNSTKSILINEALATNVQSIVHKDDDTQTDQRKKADSKVKGSTPAPQLITEEELDDSDILIKDIYVDSLNPHCEDTLHTSLHENDRSCPEEATKSSEHHLSESTFYETKTTSTNVLSRSLSFLTHVEDLFDSIDTDQPIVLKILTGLHCCDGTDSKLLMDCANELLESRSQRNIPSIHPLIQRPLQNPSFCISTDHLMQEVQNGIESLNSHRNRARESTPTNAVLALLEKDLWCIGRNIVQAWDVGWRNEFIRDEVQKIACDLDELILGELVAEALAEFCA